MKEAVQAMTIKEFLNTKPSVGQILQYVEDEARRIASERQAATGQGAQR